MDLRNNGVEGEVEFWPIEHPVEPSDEDRPVKCPIPHSSVINVRILPLNLHLSFSRNTIIIVAWEPLMGNTAMISKGPTKGLGLCLDIGKFFLFTRIICGYSSFSFH